MTTSTLNYFTLKSDGRAEQLSGRRGRRGGERRPRQPVQKTVNQGAMDRSVGETENGDAFLDLKKQPASRSPHRYTKVGFVTNEIMFLYR